MKLRWWRKPERQGFLDALREEEEERAALSHWDAYTMVKVTTRSLDEYLPQIRQGSYLFFPRYHCMGKVLRILPNGDITQLFIEVPGKRERLTA